MEKQNDITAKNPEDAATVGTFLKYTRLNQKKTLDAVSKALCIRKIYIKAIEESDFEELHPIPYGIGFVRSYAEYLGLNSDRIVQCYKEEALPPKKEENVKHHTVSTHKITTKPNRKQILIGLIVVFCIYFAWLALSGKAENKESVQALPETENTIVEEIPALPPSPASTEAEPINVAEEAGETTAEISTDSQIKITDDNYYDDSQEITLPETDSRIVVKFKGESWFEVRDDEKIYITGIFEKDYVYNVPNQPGLRLSVGRYYNVDVYVDGKLTTVARPYKQTNIDLDAFLNH